MLDKALSLDMIRQNVSEDCELPVVEKIEMHTLSDMELQRFREIAKDDPFYLMYFVDFFTGLQANKLISLTWDCIDFDQGTIRVYRQFVRIVSGPDKGKTTCMPMTFRTQCRSLPPVSRSIRNTLQTRIYEDSVLGNLPRERLQKMSRDYDAEQERLKLELEVLEESIYQQQDEANAVEQFKRLAVKYLDVPELTPTIVNEYIQKIIVYAPEKDKGIRTQRIQIVFNFADAAMDSPLNASADIVTNRQAKTA